VIRLPLTAPRRRALTVAFLGMDGAGKSTTVRNVAKTLAHLAPVQQYLGWRGDGAVDRAYLKIVKAIRMGVLINHRRHVRELDFEQRLEYLRARPTQAELALYLVGLYHRYTATLDRARDGGIVLFDRFFCDLVGADDPRPLPRLATKLVPTPDLAFLLTADEQTLRARRDAVDVARVAEFERCCLSHPALRGRTTVIDTGRVPEAAVAELAIQTISRRGDFVTTTSCARR